MGAAKPFLVGIQATSGVVRDAATEAYQLGLFSNTNGGDDVAELRKTVMTVKTAAKPPETVRAWESDWKRFTAFCSELGRNSLPASADTLQLFCARCLKDGHKVSSVRRRLWSIRGHHEQSGFENPVSRDIGKLLTARVRQVKEQPDQATALTADQVRKICSELRKIAENSDDDAAIRRAVRDRAIFVIGFGAALRRSDVGRLELSDVASSTKGVTVKIRHGKADQEGKGRTVHIWAGKTTSTNVLDALKCWLKVRGREDGSLFGIDPGTVNLVVKRGVQLIGLDASEYSGHSLRSGAATAAIAAGTDPFVVMRELTGHKDLNAFSGYVRRGKAWTIDPLRGAL